MNGLILRVICFICLPFLFYSCSETKSLEEGQYLYDGATITIKSKPELSHRKSSELKKELNGLLRPETERKLSGHPG